MIINGEQYSSQGVFRSMLTVPDCFVVNSNKLSLDSHGEKKLYLSSKEDMYNFYGKSGFTAECFMLKKDLLSYLTAIKSEYMHPSYEYRKKEQLPQLWSTRYAQIEQLDDVIFFKIRDQEQIAGPRGYIKSDDSAFQLIREISLPLVSFIFMEKVGTTKYSLFYWKLFVDFDILRERDYAPLVFSYGKGQVDDSISDKPKISQKEESRKVEIRQARIGQGKYRENLLKQCKFCPFTMISDDRLLIASHIKPWAASNDDEKLDPYNGYVLSPLYDKLFDKGFITFTDDRRILLSKFISSYTWKQIMLSDNTYYKQLPMDEKRIKYLEFHREAVFKGSV